MIDVDARYDAEVTELYEAQIDRLVTFMCGCDRTLRFQDAEDVVKGALLTARGNWAEIRVMHDPAVVAFAAAHQWMAGQQRDALSRRDILTDNSASPASTEDRAIAVRLLDALDRLDPLQRQDALLRHLLQFDARDASMILGLPSAAQIETLDAANLGAVSPEDFAALGRALQRGQRRSALSQRRFVEALAASAEHRETQHEAPPAMPQSPTSPDVGQDPQAVVASTATGRKAYSSLLLTPEQTSIIELCTGTTPAAEIAARLPVPPDVALQIITEMVGSGLLEIRRVAPAAPATANERDPTFLRRVLTNLNRI